jgi:hypothetical protein
MYVSSYCHICVLILLYMCPQVLQVARAFVAAVEAQHSLRLALGRFLRVHAAGDGEGEEGGHAAREGGGVTFDDIDTCEWRWGHRGVRDGPLREAILGELRMLTYADVC